MSLSLRTSALLLLIMASFSASMATNLSVLPASTSVCQVEESIFAEINLQASFSDGSEITIEDLAPGLGISWSHFLSENGDNLRVTGANAPTPIDPDLELARIEISDPISGVSEAYLLVSGGGASVMVIADF